MQIATNGAGWDHYDLDPSTKIISLAETGFRNVDYQFFSVAEDSPWMGDDWHSEADRLIDTCARHNVGLVQSHSPSGNPLATEDPDTHLARTLRSIEICARLGIPQIVVHPGAVDGMTRQEFLDGNRKYYQSLVPTAERLDVLLLAENIGAPYDPHFAHNGAELRALVDHVDQPSVQACWDTGHGNINGVDQYESIRDLGPALRGLHVQDNVGFFAPTPGRNSPDLHTFPFLGSINFDAVIQGLIDIGYPGHFTFEVNVPRMGTRPEFVHQGRAVATLHRPPIELCARMHQFLFETGRAMLTAYEIFEG